MINVYIKDNLFDETEVSRSSHEWEGKELKDYLPLEMVCITKEVITQLFIKMK